MELMERTPKKEEQKPKSDLETANLPFPHSRVKEILKGSLKDGTFIKKKAAIDLNLWLGKMAEKVAKDVGTTNKAYIDSEDILRVTAKFDSLEEFDKERQRIIAHLNAMKADINRLLDELNRI